MASNTVTLFGVGDVGPLHEPIAAYSELAKPALAAADIRFGQVERVYSDRGALQLHSGGAHSRVKPHMASVFTDCGFDVVSLASNHAMDWGADAMLDTIDLRRVVFVVDRTTDRGFLERELLRLWSNVAADSPNRSAPAPAVRLFGVSGPTAAETRALVAHLAAA